jgi:hypothetical protein
LLATTTPDLDALGGPELAQAAPAAGHRPIARTDEQQVLSIRAEVPKEDAERFIAAALHDIRIFMQEHHVRPAGPPFSICRAREGTLDIEAGWPTASEQPLGTSRIHSGLVPRSLTGG